MRDHKVQGGIDGTALFEEICCEVAKNYWGERADGMVFGTARRTGTSEVGTFPDAVNDLCGRLREGVEFCPHSGFRASGAGRESRRGGLEALHRRQDMASSSGSASARPARTGRTGCSRWCQTGSARNGFARMPVVEPVRLYFMTSRLRHSEWYDCSVDGGILFDRCRILDYAPKMASLKDRWLAWTRAAMESQKIRAI